MKADDSLHVDARVLEDIAKILPLEDIATCVPSDLIPGVPQGDILKFAILNQWFQHYWRSSPITSSGAHIHRLWASWISHGEEYIEAIRVVLQDAQVRQCVLTGVAQTQVLLAYEGFYVNNGVIFKAQTK